MFVFPPDPFTRLFVMVAGLVLAVVAAPVVAYSSGSLRQLGLFAVAVFGVLSAIGFPINALLNLFGGFGSLLAVVTALILTGVSYGMGYYLIYEDGYERAKTRYVGGSTGD